ncbi:hypothetical protein K435DRAFT_879309 [Dendrothele bispora CBS 962.96]|uniref:Uncharacterized protein n=1 Tax=Dendrothele bispora (strain CBS 962.96) TaxID=1314807 RepID=A0A4V4HAQ0_DENBC|nr:hypothetical protein K435DRAFT_879309 [Dendrothele bispora CBS 962.96]
MSSSASSTVAGVDSHSDFFTLLISSSVTMPNLDSDSNNSITPRQSAIVYGVVFSVVGPGLCFLILFLFQHHFKGPYLWILSCFSDRYHDDYRDRSFVQRKNRERRRKLARQQNTIPLPVLNPNLTTNTTVQFAHPHPDESMFESTSEINVDTMPKIGTRTTQVPSFLPSQESDS